MKGDIYSQCSRCIAWLDKADSKPGIAFELLRAIELKAREALMIPGVDSYYRLPPYTSPQENSLQWRLYFDVDDDGFYTAMKSPDICNLGPEESCVAEEYRAVYESISMKWFLRMWILQEFVLP